MTSAARRWLPARPGWSPGAIPALDGLRAIAVVLVLLRHAIRPFWMPDASPLAFGGIDLATPLLNGWIGVDLFFVLSGFLIFRHLDDARAAGRFSWPRYFGRRLRRVVPTYFAVLGLVVAGCFPYYTVSSDGLGLRLAYHLVFAQDYLPADIVVAFWSLGVEEKWYLLAPLLFFAARRPARHAWLVLFGVILLAPLLRTLTMAVAPVDAYQPFFATLRSPFHQCLDALGLGAAAYLLTQGAWQAGLQHRAATLFWSGTAIITALLVGTPMMEGGIGWFDATIQPTLVAGGFALMVLGAALGGGPAMLSGGTGLVLARLSYPLYLVHLPLLPLTTMLAGGSFMTFVPLFLAASLVAAYALHIIVERPFLVPSGRDFTPVPRPTTGDLR